MRPLPALALLAAGFALILAFEPHMHAWTALALGCGLLSYGGALIAGVGLCGLVMNDAVERAGARLLGL